VELKNYFEEDCSRKDFSHRIHVRNSLSSQPDTKTFRFVYDLAKTQYLFDKVKDFLFKHIEEEKSKLLFAEDTKTTHYITIKEKNGKSFSFHVEASFLSSCDIGEVLESYLCAGKVKPTVKLLFKIQTQIQDCEKSEEKMVVNS
jgi:hypothetical protein